ncbi:MAG: flagellar hook-basal body complex protein [Azospirillum sp.]|nr:flagellar hook-basal body complex protein [Azospirillum sp.]
MGIGAAFTTGVLGLNAFAAQVGHISDNLANVGTIGYKRVDTSFQSFVTRSTPTLHDPGGVTANPVFRNSTGGSVVASDNTTSVAIADGVGFIPTKLPSVTNGTANFTSSPQHYTRAGDFTLDANGYLVNTTGEYLLGMQEQTTYQEDIPNSPSLASLVGVRVDPTVYRSVPGVASSTIDYNANFPAGAAIDTTAAANTPDTGSYVTSQVQFFDTVGNARTLQITYVKTADDTWTVATQPTYGATYEPQVLGFTTQPTITLGGVTDLTFNSAGALTLATPAQIDFDVDWSTAVAGTGVAPPPPTLPTQTITLDYGEPASGTTAATGSTMYAGTTLEVRSVDDQTGQPPGSFQKASIDKDGYVIFSYSNGEAKKTYRVPLITFNNADKLVRTSGSVFVGDDLNAGPPIAKWPGEGDAGRVIPSSFEQSNVDLGEELTKLIVAQRAYSSNGKVITTSDEMIQEVLNLKR